MSDSPIDAIERWEAFGGTWRARSSAEAVVIELCTCDGEPIDLVRVSGTQWLEELARRDRLRA